MNKIATLFFYMPKDNEDNIFSRAKNIESLLRIDMNIAYKGSVRGIVHFFETQIAFSCSSRVYAYSKVHLSRFSTLESRASILASQNSNVSTFASRESSFEDRVETVNLPLSGTVIPEG